MLPTSRVRAVAGRYGTPSAITSSPATLRSTKVLPLGRAAWIGSFRTRSVPLTKLAGRSEWDRGLWALGIPVLRQKKRRSGWPLCHNKTTALPMTLAPLIGPQDRLSHESDRLSPIT